MDTLCSRGLIKDTRTRKLSIIAKEALREIRSGFYLGCVMLWEITSTMNEPFPRPYCYHNLEDRLSRERRHHLPPNVQTKMVINRAGTHPWVPRTVPSTSSLGTITFPSLQTSNPAVHTTTVFNLMPSLPCFNTDMSFIYFYLLPTAEICPSATIDMSVD